MVEFQGEDHPEMLVIRIGTNNISRDPVTPEVGTAVADFLNGNVTRWNKMIRSLVRSNPSELRLIDLENMLRMIDHLALTRDCIHLNTL